MNSLVIGLSIIQLILTRINRAMSLWLVILSIPLYTVRLYPLGLPTNLFEIILAVTFLGLLLDKRLARLEINRNTLIATGLVVIGLIAGVLYSPDQLAAINIVKSWFIVPFILGWTVYSLVNKDKIGQILQSLLVSTLPLSLLALYQQINTEYITIDQRVSAWFDSSNYLSLYLAPILVMGMIYNRQVSGTQKNFNWLVIGLGILAVIYSGSLGGVSALVVGLIVGSISYRLTFPRKLIVPSVLLSAIVIYFAPTIFYVTNLFDRASLLVRYQVWEVATNMIQSHWLWGLGLKSFETNYPTYVGALQQPIIETNILHSHNLLFETWINLGLVGLLGCLWLVIQWVYQLVSIKDKIILATLGSGLAVIFFHGVIDVSFFKNDLSTVFAIIISLIYVTTQKSAKT